MTKRKLVVLVEGYRLDCSRRWTVHEQIGISVSRQGAVMGSKDDRPKAVPSRSARRTPAAEGQTKRWSVLFSAIRHKTGAVAIDAGSGKKSPSSGPVKLFDVWSRA
jgi:hypothetical protein